MDYDREARKFMRSLTTFHDGEAAERRLARLLRKAAHEARGELLPSAPTPADEPSYPVDLPAGDGDPVPA